MCMKSSLWFLGDIVKTILIALVIVIPIRTFVFQPFVVKGSSMKPNFHNGDYLLVDELSYRFREPKRGEVIVFTFPYNTSETYIKRIIGLPGETIEIGDNKVVIVKPNHSAFVLAEPYLRGLPTSGAVHITLQKGEYFVMGDNRPYSSDSRVWGVLDSQYIIGRVLFKVWPLKDFGPVTRPVYLQTQ